MSHFYATVKHHKRKGLGRMFVVSALLTLTGCNAPSKQQAKDLVKDGTANSVKLTDYFARLEGQNEDYLDLYEYRQNRGERSIDDNLKNLYEQQNEALDSRKKLAQGITGVYDSLGKLIDYDAQGEVKKATNDLMSEINGLVTLPGTPVDLKTDLGPIAGLLVSQYQNRQFKKLVPSAFLLTDHFGKGIERERTVYDQIAQRFESERAEFAVFTVDPGGAVDPNKPYKLLEPDQNPDLSKVGQEQAMIVGPYQKYLDDLNLKFYEVPIGDVRLREVTRYTTVRNIRAEEIRRKRKAREESRSLSNGLYAQQQRLGVFLHTKTGPPYILSEDIDDHSMLVRRFKEEIKRRYSFDRDSHNAGKPYVPEDAFADVFAKAFTPEFKARLISDRKIDQSALAEEVNRTLGIDHLIFRIVSSEFRKKIDNALSIVIDPTKPVEPQTEARNSDFQEIFIELDRLARNKTTDRVIDSRSPALTSDIRALIQQDVAGKAQVRMNRLLLEYAIPNAVKGLAAEDASVNA